MSVQSVPLDRSATNEVYHRVTVVSQRLGVSKPTLYAMADRGDIRCIRFRGTGERENVRVPESAIAEFIASHQHGVRK